MEFILRRFLAFCFVVLIGFSCDSNSGKPNENTASKNRDSFNFKSDIEKQIPQTEFYPLLNVKDSNIVNTTHLKIDVLYNGIKDFLNGKLNKNIRFPTDCITCNSIQKFNNHLLFGKRLKISYDKVEFLNKDTILPAKNNIPRIKSDYDKWSTKNIIKQTNFNFSQGKGFIKFLKHSCDDADFELIKLNYKDGFVEIKNLIGIEIFEYDLNKDGTKEQYLMGMRNCTQEIAIIRIRPD